MANQNEISTVQDVSRKYLNAVKAFLDNKIDKQTLLDIQDEFQDTLNDSEHYELTIKLVQTTQVIQQELGGLLALAEKIDDHHLNKAIINAEKIIEEIGAIGEMNYVAKPE